MHDRSLVSHMEKCVVAMFLSINPIAYVCFPCSTLVSLTYSNNRYCFEISEEKKNRSYFVRYSVYLTSKHICDYYVYV